MYSLNATTLNGVLTGLHASAGIGMIAMQGSRTSRTVAYRALGRASKNRCYILAPPQSLKRSTKLASLQPV